MPLPSLLQRATAASVLLLLGARAALGCVEHGNPVTSRRARDEQANTITLLTGMPFTEAGVVNKWHAYVDGAAGQSMNLQIWRPVGHQQWQLACQDTVTARGTGSETFGGSCEYLALDVMGVDTPAAGLVTWDNEGEQTLWSATSKPGATQFYETAPKVGDVLDTAACPSVVGSYTGGATRRSLQALPCKQLPVRQYSLSATTGCLINGWGVPFILAMFFSGSV